jgi:hypothetical protein
MSPSRTATLTVFAGMLAASFIIAAADAPASEEGFVPLFNGKDTTGWVYGIKGGKTAKTGNGYQVKDGVLYCTKTDGGNLFTEKDYADFVLRFDFKLEPNANNGLGIRAPLEGDVAYTGMELQILDDSGSEYTQLKPVQYHGSVYGCVAAKRGSLKPVGEWNTQEVVVHGRHVKVTLNGNVIVDADLDRDITDPEVRAKHPGLERKTGRIGFLGHGTRVEFRNIRVKELK